MSDSEIALAGRLKRQEAGALGEAYDRYSRPVFAMLLRMTGERPVAEELLQEAFLRLWRKSAAFEPERGALLPWLLTMARNLALDRIRSSSERQRRLEAFHETLPEAGPLNGGDAWPDAKLQAERIRSLLSDLPEEQRKALELAYFEGMSHSEIAAAMERPLGTVKTWLRSGLLRLRERLGAAQ
ncbi:MAG: sigma-70 family RNA polymerase sigma factor [Bryobacterales bacterium]